MTDTGSLARTFLTTLEARDWGAWQALLVPDVTYVMPQTRERIRGREAYLAFNVTYPGDWHLEPKVVVGEESRAVVWFGWRLGDESGDAVVFLEFDADGLITEVTDFWPEPYEPPERVVDGIERY